MSSVVVALAKYMPRRKRPPSPPWPTFLANHASQIVAADFFVVPTVTYRLLFVLVLLAHERRRLVHVAVTAHPTAAWTWGSLKTRRWPDRSPQAVRSSRSRRWADSTTATIGARRRATHAIRRRRRAWRVARSCVWVGSTGSAPGLPLDRDLPTADRGPQGMGFSTRTPVACSADRILTTDTWPYTARTRARACTTFVETA
jgi:hypothetical protein